MEQDIEKIQRICQLIYRIWKKEYNNSLRLSQLISNCFENEEINNFFYITDEELEVRLKQKYGDKI